MSHVTTAPAPRALPRQALGLPAGSVRALLAFGVLGALWLLVLKHGSAKMPMVFVYLQFLMLMIMAHYFTAHGHTIGEHISASSPLGLPRGSVRFLLLVGYAGLVIYLYRTQPEFEYPPTGDFLLLLTLLVTGYFLGHYITAIIRGMSGGTLPFWYQDVCAWLALLAVIGLGILLIVYLVINPNAPPEDKVETPTVDAILAAIVGYYFGARS
jgi:hypothetical protein